MAFLKRKSNSFSSQPEKCLLNFLRRLGGGSVRQGLPCGMQQLPFRDFKLFGLGPFWWQIQSPDLSWAIYSRSEDVGMPKTNSGGSRSGSGLLGGCFGSLANGAPWPGYTKAEVFRIAPRRCTCDLGSGGDFLESLRSMFPMRVGICLECFLQGRPPGETGKNRAHTHTHLDRRRFQLCLEGPRQR